MFTQQQLDVFWSQYVGLTAEQVRIATTPGQDGFLGNDWSAMLAYVFKNRLYGFSDYSGGTASNPKFIGGRGIFNGPTKS